MNILDENIPEHQRQKLKSWRIRRFLLHPEFNTQAKRMGTVIRISPIGIHLWQRHAEEEIFISWNDSSN